MDELSQEMKDRGIGKPKLKPIEQLDYLLEFLSNNMHAKPKISLVDILKYTDYNICDDGAELVQVLNKLIKDGYADFENVNMGVSALSYPEVDTYIRYFFATFEGKFLISMEGGYQGLHLRQHAESIRLAKLEKLDRANRNAQTWLTVLIAFGTLVAAVYYGIEVWKFYHSLHL